MTTPAESLLEALKQPLEEEDLDFIDDLTEEDTMFASRFEAAWSEFLSQRPDLIPQGPKGKRLLALEERLKNGKESKDAVEMELQKQIQFFRSSRENLENLFATKMNQAMEEQRALHDALQAKLDTVAMADHLMGQTLPWQNFLQRMDQIAGAATSEEQVEPKAGQKQVAKPSGRAMALTDQSSGDAADIQLRAYRIDHALLTTNIKMLQKEIERYAKTIESQETAGHFLTEHNVWSLLGDRNKGNLGGQSMTTGHTTMITKSQA